MVLHHHVARILSPTVIEIDKTTTTNKTTVKMAASVQITHQIPSLVFLLGLLDHSPTVSTRIGN
jgi:hypothetical protein